MNAGISVRMQAQYMAYPLDGAKSYILSKKGLQAFLALLGFTGPSKQGGKPEGVWMLSCFCHLQVPGRGDL